MRTVFILHDRASQRSWVAVDRFSGAPLLRLHHYEQLKGVCSRLGWAIASDVETTAQTTEANGKPAGSGTGKQEVPPRHVKTRPHNDNQPVWRFSSGSS